MHEATRDNLQRDRLDRYRWALEPALGSVFLAGWAIVGLRSGNNNELATILLLSASIAVSRLSPAAGLANGALALLLQLAGFTSGLTATGWAFVVAGMLVFFGTAAYGSPVVRWFGLAAALLLTLVTTGLTIAPSFPDAVVRMFVMYAVVAAIVTALLVGAWLLGLAVSRRAAAAAAAASDERSTVERWLTRPDPWTSPAPGPGRPAVLTTGPAGIADADADDTGTRLFRPLSRLQLAVDITIAVLFAAFGLLASAPESWAEPAVLFILAVALVFRRAAPPLALGIVWAAAILQMALRLGVLSSDVAILVVLYATAAYGGRLTRWAGLASAGVGAVVAAAYLALLQYGPGPLESTALDPMFLPEAVRNFLTLFVASAGVLGLAWTLGFLVRTWRRARLSRSLAALAIEDQRAAERSVVVEQERNRIARDMHDVVAHSLAVVIAQADGARYARAGDPGAVDTALTTIAATAREALGDVRILLAQLRTDETGGPQPVLADLERLLEQLRSAGLAISWSESGAPLPLGSGGQLAVYRIIQEALTNALRHGDPGADVFGSLAWDDAGVTVTIENAVPADGTAEEHAVVGHGLPGMRERALLAGGTLTVDTPPGRFRVIAHIPASPSAMSVPAPPTADDSAEGALQ